MEYSHSCHSTNVYLEEGFGATEKLSIEELEGLSQVWYLRVLTVREKCGEHQAQPGSLKIEAP